MTRVLIIEDDAVMASLIEEAMAEEKFVVDVATNGREGLDFLQFYQYDLAIIDWHLPGMSGFEVCKEYRRNGGKTSILFLTANKDVTDRVDALEEGADDYLCKPFDYRELVARTKALLRRPATVFEARLLRVGTLELDLNRKEARLTGNAISLAPSEFQLLELLMKSPGKVFSSGELLDRVFKSEVEASDDAVRKRINRLRKKIDIGGEQSLIKTIKGLGYSISA